MRILLIEDDSGSALAMSRLLTDEGFVVHHAPTIHDAFFHLSAHEYDAIVTDVDMPHTTAIEGIGYLRQRHHGPIVAVTGWGLSPTERALFDGYLRKPIEVASDLVGLLRSLLRSRMS